MIEGELDDGQFLLLLLVGFVPVKNIVLNHHHLRTCHHMIQLYIPGLGTGYVRMMPCGLGMALLSGI